MKSNKKSIIDVACHETFIASQWKVIDFVKKHFIIAFILHIKYTHINKYAKLVHSLLSAQNAT